MPLQSNIAIYSQRLGQKISLADDTTGIDTTIEIHHTKCLHAGLAPGPVDSQFG